MLFRSNDTATTEIYTQQDTLSLHDALPIFAALLSGRYRPRPGERVGVVVSGGNTVAVDFSR